MAEDVFEIVGTVVGGSYNVEAVVAEGGFAVVYRAYHGAFHAPVALKCLKVPSVGRSDQTQFLESFREEGEVLFRLSQSIPAVVRPLHVDAFETSKGVFVPYMALEWLEGEALDVMIARRAAEGRPPMSLKRVVRMLSPVARALARAHNFPGPNGPVSIVHRDLKPDNIVVANVAGEEVVKVLDFGIAKVKSVATQVAGRQSQEGGKLVPFTPGYAAPEQWFPKRYGQSGPWTDIWGLALTVVESITGKAAIDGDHGAMMGTAVDERRRPTPRAEGLTISDEVETVFLKALAVDPRERYQEVGRFWDDLEKAAGLARSQTPASGFASQPYRDPRHEGDPPQFEERIEAASPSQRPSSLRMGSTPMSEPDKRAETLDAPVRSGAMPLLPDLDLAPVRIEIASQNVGPVRKPSQPQMRAISRDSDNLELNIATGTPPPVSAKPAHPEPTAKPPSVETSSVDKSQGQSELDRQANKSRNGASGIDLAVSPIEVRRASATSMRAVRVPVSQSPSAPNPTVSNPPNVPPVSSGRSGQYRATSIPRSSAPTPATGTGQKILLPVLFSIVGVAMSVAFYINASLGGGRWMIGPIPINWIAGLFVVGGVTATLFRLFWRYEE